MASQSLHNLRPVIDALGHLRAQIAPLVAQEDALKAQLTEMGPGAYDGELFRVTVSVSQRETLDMKAVRAKLSPQFIAAHTKVSDVRSLRVTARIAVAA